MKKICAYNERTNERTDCVCMCVGLCFVVEDDETERDSQLIGYDMNHLIQVWYTGAITKNNQFRKRNL
jgi:hypothetical protein